MIGNPKTNLDELQKAFGEAIMFIRETDSTGLTSSLLFQRATIVFSDNSLMYVTEKLTKQGAIIEYYYDWISSDKSTIAKFHSEPHDQEDYQTETEPYHVHPPDYAKLNNKKRYPNFYHKDLFSIIEGIFFFRLLPNTEKK